LRALISVAEIEAVITRPDRPKGRSGSVSPPPVKEAALGAGLTVFQPPTTAELSVLLLDLPPVDVAVVVAFGMLIRPDALAVPGAGFVNVHFSVLPRWRGAAPVQRAIMAGDARTGVTLMRLDAGLDTGPILSTLTTAVAPDEDTPALTRRLAEAGGTLLAEVLSDIVEGRVVAVPQDERAASFAPRIHGDERWLDLDAPRAEILRRIRGLRPWPGTWVRHADIGVRLLEADPSDDLLPVGQMKVIDGAVVVGVADGGLRLRRVQPEGRRPMDAADWLRGVRGGPGRLE
jgi:methionyl-tRNA formyltransferase